MSKFEKIKFDNFESPQPRFPSLSDMMTDKVLVFDYELNNTYKQIKNIYDVFTRAKKRFERRQTLNLAKSAVEYIQLQKDKEKYPYVLYDFVCDTVRICICHYRSLYHISVVGWQPVLRFGVVRSKTGVPTLYCDFENLDEAAQCFCDVVRDYMRSVFTELF